MYRVEGRRPVGRPRKTWLESVEVDMAELEIDKEDVHDRSKWRRIVNVMKRKSNPIGDYKRHSLQAVELSQWFQAAVQIVSNLPAPSNGGPIYRFLGMRTRWLAGAAAHKSG